MREFLLSISVNPADLDEKTEFVFMPGYSSTPPAWDDIKTNNARRTRAFSASGSPGNTREVYFSISPTGDNKLNGINLDLSSPRSANTSERDLLDNSGSGVMAPNTGYYIHAYTKEGRYLASSEKITTTSYPASTDIPTTNIAQGASILTAFWGMSMWISGNALTTPEMRAGEPNYLPYRFIPLFNTVGNPCAGVTTLTIAARGTSSFDVYVDKYPTVSTDENRQGAAAVRGASQFSSNYYDLSVPWNPVTQKTGGYSIQMSVDCAFIPSSGVTPTDMGAATRQFTIVSE